MTNITSHNTGKTDMAKAHKQFNYETSNSFRTYATYATADKKMQKLIADIADDVNITYLIMATEDGRFKGVVLGDRGNGADYMHYFIHNGAAVLA